MIFSPPTVSLSPNVPDLRHTSINSPAIWHHHRRAADMNGYNMNPSSLPSNRPAQNTCYAYKSRFAVTLIEFIFEFHINLENIVFPIS
jgi:hypothetical protein